VRKTRAPSWSPFLFAAVGLLAHAAKEFATH
jgi:hypothetical protein